MAPEQTIPTGEEFDQRIQSVLARDFGTYIDLMRENSQRVARLISVANFILSQATGDTLKEAQLAADDIVRSAIVLTHAYSEDVLRTAAATLLPAADESCLNDIPLAGSGGTGRAEKFSLRDLARHKGKSVDELIRESVSEHLSRSTFSNTIEIARLLLRLGIDVSKHNQNFPAIEEMNQRRHQIVHRADRVKAVDSDTWSLQPVDLRKLAEWTAATFAFAHSLAGPIASMLYTPETIEQKFGIPVDAFLREITSRNQPQKSDLPEKPSNQS
jgi:HEPN superfamily RiboL-PSP-like protein